MRDALKLVNNHSNVCDCDINTNLIKSISVCAPYPNTSYTIYLLYISK